MNGLIAIELTNDEALLFRAFMQYRTQIAFMLEQGVFDVKRGQVILNFDRDSKLLSIEKRICNYAKAVDK